jgi:hypothetical protein
MNARLRLLGSSFQLLRRLGVPPSMRMQVPVMYAAAGDSRYTMAPDTSASVPKRLSGTTSVNSRIFAFASGV